MGWWVEVEKGRFRVVGNYLLLRGKGWGNRWVEEKGGKDPRGTHNCYDHDK